MTYKELPDYCEKHMCPCYVDKGAEKCEYQNLCTRFVKKYNLHMGPSEAKKRGLIN